MPLVTRTANSSQVYSQATAPTITMDGEVWIDTDTGAVYTSENGVWVVQSAGAIGTARQGLMVNTSADALQYVASMQSLLTAQGDTIYASAANTPARLAKGTAGQALKMNSGATAPEWGSAGLLTLLDYHEATGAEATYTFTPGTSLDNDTYSEILIIIDGRTTASCALLMRLNGASDAGYYWVSDRVAAGGSTITTGDAVTSLQLVSTTILSGASMIYGIVHLLMTDVSGQLIQQHSKFNDGRIYEDNAGNGSPSSPITSITVLTSTSTWQTGTKIIMYGLKRA